jgi:hypothetical protein
MEVEAVGVGIVGICGGIEVCLECADLRRKQSPKLLIKYNRLD